jgi:hypothetical protein
VDNLQLTDEWTNFFRTVGNYDFQDEINVEVLGNLFERSVGELERIRLAGLFSTGRENGDEAEPAMAKSPERKRFGIYYTPLEFTAFIVYHTVGPVVAERWQQLRKNTRRTPVLPRHTTGSLDSTNEPGGAGSKKPMARQRLQCPRGSH